MSDCPPEVIEVRRDERGELDELVAQGCVVRLEQLDAGIWWLAVEKDGYRQVVTLHTRGDGRLVVGSEMDGWP